MTDTAPVSKTVGKKVKRIRIAQLKEYEQLIQAMDVVSTVTSKMQELVGNYRRASDDQIALYFERMQRHVSDPNIVPVIVFKPQPKNRWTVAVNDKVYELGPLPDFEHIDEDDPRFYWAGPDGERHLARSMFQALVGVVQAFSRRPDITT